MNDSRLRSARARLDETALLALGSAADSGVWVRLRTLGSSLGQVAGVRAQAELLRLQPIAEMPAESYTEFERTGDRTEYEARYFQRRRRLAALALSALLDPSEDTADLVATIEAICEEPMWAVPAHKSIPDWPRDEIVDLFAAETGSALAEITALLGDRLPEAVVQSAREHVTRRVLEPYERTSFWWEQQPNNWSAVCAGSVALAALQLWDRARVLKIAPRLRASLHRSLDAYGDDGVCVEGFVYWHYGFGYYLVAMQALDAAVGPEPGEPARAAEVARWSARAHLSCTAVVPFADTPVYQTVSVGLLAIAARRYGQIARVSSEIVTTELIDRCGRWALALHGLCALPEAVGDAPFDRDAQPPPLWYPDAQWLVVPQGERSPIGFAARAGGNDEPHNHNDLGSFAIAADGELLIGDAGCGVYDREYFGATRYDNPAAGSQGHSVPLLDDVRQHDGPDARAEVLDWALEHGRELFRMDLTSAYGHPGVVSLIRTFEREGASVQVRDEMRASGEKETVRLTQRLVCLREPRVVEPGIVHVAGDRRTAEIAYDPALAVALGPFPIGRGGFEIPAFWVDLTTSSAESSCVTSRITVL